MPKLEKLNLAFVGPDLPEGHNQSGDLAICPACALLHRRRTFFGFRGAYHAYAVLPSLTRPDLAVMFDSGRAQVDMELWAPTIGFLVEHGILTLGTTFNKGELVEEVVDWERRGRRIGGGV